MGGMRVIIFWGGGVTRVRFEGFEGVREQFAVVNWMMRFGRNTPRYVLEG